MQKDTFTDPRDGRRYEIVKIGEQTWMAENLAYAAEGSVCYDNDPANCEKYGRLYDWETAMKVCPPGWHLPSGEEWDKLLRFVDGSTGSEKPNHYHSITAGKHLKAVKGWNHKGNGTDRFGFSALPGGRGEPDGSFYGARNCGYWWNTSEDAHSLAYYRSMCYNSEDVGRYNFSRCLYSVRCVGDN